MSAEQIQTIEDMQKLFYSQAGEDLINEIGVNEISKADAPIITTTTGVYNAVYGAQAWVQLNTEANTFGSLPKAVFKKSGWRVISARTETLPTGGRSETAALPDTVKPTFVEISAKPKIVAKTFQVGAIQEYLVTSSNDDAFGSMSDMRTYMAAEFKEEINVELNTQNGTLASNNMESIDRVIASNAEFANSKENDESTAYTANDLDVFSLDRDAAAAWHDAYVSYSGTSGSARVYTDSLIQTVMQNTLKNGANVSGQHWQTGWDTWASTNQLFTTQVRYNIIGEAKVSPGVNGVKAPEGNQVGLMVSTLYGKPVIISKNTVADTGGISRLYLIDTSNPEGFDLPRICVKMAMLPTYFEAGVNNGQPFAVNTFGNKGMYLAMGELNCAFFAAQGKIRDLK